MTPYDKNDPNALFSEILTELKYLSMNQASLRSEVNDIKISVGRLNEAKAEFTGASRVYVWVVGLFWSVVLFLAEKYW